MKIPLSVWQTLYLIWSLSLLFINSSSAAAQTDQCATNISTCAVITDVVINEQEMNPNDTLTTTVGDTIYVEAVNIEVSSPNLLSLSDSHGGLNYAYAYAFPTIDGTPTEQIVQFTPASQAISTLSSGSSTIELDGEWVVNTDWDWLNILILHYDSHQGREIVIGRAIILLNVESESVTPSTPEPQHIPRRAIWLWQEQAITYEPNHQVILEQLVSWDINYLYLHSYNAVRTNQPMLATFIDLAQERNIEIELLAGDPLWALDDYHSDALAFVNDVIDFAEAYSNQAPIGIHLDIEPYILTEWIEPSNSSSNHVIAIQYLQLLQSVKDRIDTSQTELTLHVDVPFWFDEIFFTYNNVNSNMIEHIMSIVDEITVMAYRDRPDGENGTISLSEFEVEQAHHYDVKVTIAFETNSGLLPQVTFCEEGVDALISAIETVNQAFENEHSYIGTAIHDYIGLDEIELCN